MTETVERQHELDWIRVLAVAAVFLQHTFNPYAGGGVVVSNDAVSPALRGVALATAGMRMPLMFFVAGASLVVALGRKEVGAYVRDRSAKLLIPLLIGLLVLVPSQLLVVAAADGSLSRMGILAAGSPLRPDGTVFWAHLWFLAHIVVATVLLLPAAIWLRGAAARLAGRGWAAHPATLVAFGALPLAALAVRYSWLQDFPIMRVLDLRQLTNSVAFVACGMLVAALPALGETATRCRGTALLCWVCLTALRLGLGSTADAAWVEYAMMVLASAAAWAWVLGAYGYARHHLRRGSPLLSRLAGSSYGFYLIHQPLLVAAAVMIVPLSLPIWLESIMLGSIAFILSVGACEAARQTAVTRYALGFRERRSAPRAATAPAHAPVTP